MDEIGPKIRPSSSSLSTQTGLLCPPGPRTLSSWLSTRCSKPTICVACSKATAWRWPNPPERPEHVGCVDPL